MSESKPMSGTSADRNSGNAVAKWKSPQSIAAYLFVAALFVLGVWFFWFRNPLPSDEEMIAHFQAQRTQIEELVKRYREFQRPPDKDHDLWQAPAEVQAIKRTAGVYRVDYVAGLWLPDPYSVETAKRKDALVLMKDEERGFDLFPRYGTIQVGLAPHDRYIRNTARYSVIWKRLLFYPETPKVEEGWLLHPSGARGEPGNRYRVFDSLNDFPPDWKRGECVMRRIEPQWFIDMCRST